MDETEQSILGRMAEDIRRTARPKIAAVTEQPVVPIGAAAVARRLEQLIETARSTRERAGVLATALAGPSPDQPAEERASHPEHLFGRQLAGLDELTLVIQGIDREVERAIQSLD